MSLEPPQDNVPEENQPLEQKEEMEQEEKKKKPVEDQEENEEEEEAEGKKKKPFSSKRISVTMYGILSGQYKCDVCKTAHQFFSSPKNWKYFTYKHIDVMSDKGQKMAKRQGISNIPFFRVRRPGETTDEWIKGYNESEWDGMIKHVG